MQAIPFQQALLAWYQQHGRKDLPWKTTNPYHIWLSEIMLQQTQVQTVVGYFLNFIARFPTIDALAEADEDAVMHAWAGLGYYARARNLHRAAQIMVERHDRQFPTQFDDVLALPGIGRSTAGAILSFAYGQTHAILDGNVKRVLTRFYGIDGYPGLTAVEKQLWQKAAYLTPKDNKAADYNQAIMDIGATICTRRQPSCKHCPIIEGCVAFKTKTTERYPTPKPKAVKPTKTTQMLAILYNNKVLLYKRPSKGIWGGLWSLPEIANTDCPSQWCKNHLSVKRTSAKPLATFRHTFTHYHLDITPTIVDLEHPPTAVLADGQWVDITTPLDLGTAKPVQTILKRIKSELVTA